MSKEILKKQKDEVKKVKRTGKTKKTEIADNIENTVDAEVEQKPTRKRKKKIDTAAHEELNEKLKIFEENQDELSEHNADAEVEEASADVSIEDINPTQEELAEVESEVIVDEESITDDELVASADVVGGVESDSSASSLDEEEETEEGDDEYEESDRAAAQTAQGTLDDDDYVAYIGIIRELLHKGKEKGYLSFDDIEKKIPKQIINTEILDNIYSMITEMGIDVVEDQQAANDGTDMQKAEDEADMDDISLSDPVRMYLREIGRIPLLTIEDEARLAKGIADSKEAVRAKYESEMTSFFTEQKREEIYERLKASEKRPLTDDVLLEINGKVQETLAGEAAQKEISKNVHKALEFKRDKRDDHKLLEANLRLVVSIAKKYIGRGLNFLDLIQEGNLGLIKAVDKFDYNRGFKFSTYATWWIRQAITRAIADQARTIRIPVHMVETINKLIRASRALVQELGREPTSIEIAEKMGLSREKVEEIQKIAQEPVSLEKPIGEEEDSQLGDFLEDKDLPNPEEATARTILREQLEEMLNGISERERDVLRKRYCLENGKQQTLEEVGHHFGVTRERIRQIEGKALRKLRHPSKAKRLKDFLPS